MLLCGKRSRMKNESLNITLNNVPVECVNEMKYLGIIIDRHLSFNGHVNILCGKYPPKLVFYGEYVVLLMLSLPKCYTTV